MKILVLLILVAMVVVAILVVRAARKKIRKPVQIQRSGNYSTQSQVGGGTIYQGRETYSRPSTAIRPTSKPVSKPEKRETDDSETFVASDYTSEYAGSSWDFADYSQLAQGVYESPAPSYDPPSAPSYDPPSSSSYDSGSSSSSYDSGSSSSSSDY